MNRTTRILILIIIIILGITAWFLLRPDTEKQLINPEPVTSAVQEQKVTEIETNLDTPWEMVELPDKKILVTERNGRMHIVGSNVSFNIPGVIETSEGGLLGMALHPKFVENKFLYIYFTTKANNKTVNRVVRYVFDGKSVSGAKTIIDAIPAGSVHNGGRIAFGPDGYLYIATGEAGEEKLAQDINSLGGKILRIKDDGGIPIDNPFKNAVYSYGHRNPQGLAWDANDGLWSTEHGRSGVQSGYDELNYIEKGGNYGWPIIEGDETKEGMHVPVLHSGATTTWAPSSLAYLDGKLYFNGLKGKTLYVVPVTSSGKVGELSTMFANTYGRLRAVTSLKDGSLLIATSNKDGRGDPQEGDDKVLKVMLSK
ncbi:MAG TPA: PQQ-dependent sugar dehydrogenase [Candidatus Paceibacterota bacterium]